MLQNRIQGLCMPMQTNSSRHQCQFDRDNSEQDVSLPPHCEAYKRELLLVRDVKHWKLLVTPLHLAQSEFLKLFCNSSSDTTLNMAPDNISGGDDATAPGPRNCFKRKKTATGADNFDSAPSDVAFVTPKRHASISFHFIAPKHLEASGGSESICNAEELLDQTERSHFKRYRRTKSTHTALHVERPTHKSSPAPQIQLKRACRPKFTNSTGAAQCDPIETPNFSTPRITGHGQRTLLTGVEETPELTSHRSANAKLVKRQICLDACTPVKVFKQPQPFSENNEELKIPKVEENCRYSPGHGPGIFSRKPPRASIGSSREGSPACAWVSSPPPLVAQIPNYDSNSDRTSDKSLSFPKHKITSNSDLLQLNSPADRYSTYKYRLAGAGKQDDDSDSARNVILDSANSRKSASSLPVCEDASVHFEYAKRKAENMERCESEDPSKNYSSASPCVFSAQDTLTVETVGRKSAEDSPTPLHRQPSDKSNFPESTHFARKSQGLDRPVIVALSKTHDPTLDVAYSKRQSPLSTQGSRELPYKVENNEAYFKKYKKENLADGLEDSGRQVRGCIHKRQPSLLLRRGDANHYDGSAGTQNLVHDFSPEGTASQPKNIRCNVPRGSSSKPDAAIQLTGRAEAHRIVEEKASLDCNLESARVPCESEYEGGMYMGSMCHADENNLENIKNRLEVEGVVTESRKHIGGNKSPRESFAEGAPPACCSSAKEYVSAPGSFVAVPLERSTASAFVTDHALLRGSNSRTANNDHRGRLPDHPDSAVVLRLHQFARQKLAREAGSYGTPLLRGDSSSSTDPPSEDDREMLVWKQRMRTALHNSTRSDTSLLVENESDFCVPRINPGTVFDAPQALLLQDEAGEALRGNSPPT